MDIQITYRYDSSTRINTWKMQNRLFGQETPKFKQMIYTCIFIGWLFKKPYILSIIINNRAEKGSDWCNKNKQRLETERIAGGKDGKRN